MTALIEARGIGRSYRSFSLVGRSAPKTVLDGVDLAIQPGETLGLLGRSGCGKSTLGRLILGLEKPDRGDIRFKGTALSALDGEAMLAFRRAVQVVFQDSLEAVNPRHSVERIVAEPLRHLTDLDERQRAARVRELLVEVGLAPDDAEKLPVQMSGGQLQRVCIARALAPQPELIVLDEAVSNLDLVLQIQTIDLFKQIQAARGTAFLFVTHDLRLVHRFCERVIVMDGGRIVENVPVTRPLHFTHPAARALQGAVLPARPAQRHEQRTY
ncbi:Ni(2(+)) ABC transporter ATP binding subunit NikE [Hyphomicrobiales bacterium]|nr:Ni(2(+)) ABC transporter ATP binding subunit NikE [Hyphomicrobiales bacterium]CAH1672953.1 Ni(2(+)) ABC transporter ATP binding subunit NikE [Hyphomicrobiales bacterium]